MCTPLRLSCCTNILGLSDCLSVLQSPLVTRDNVIKNDLSNVARDSRVSRPRSGQGVTVGFTRACAEIHLSDRLCPPN